MTGIVATAEIDIAAEPDRVWETLTDPAAVKQWMFGTELDTDWQVGSPIVWKGEYEGKSYEDKGEVLDVRRTAHVSRSVTSARPPDRTTCPRTTTRSCTRSRPSTTARTSR